MTKVEERARKGKFIGKEQGQSSKHENKVATDNQTEDVSTVRPKGTFESTARRKSTVRKLKLDSIVTTRRTTAQV